jgi:hypothetical protein
MSRILRQLLILKSTSLTALLAFASHGQAQSSPIYPSVNLAVSDISSATVKAAREHKRILLDFGGNSDPDCLALEAYFHRQPNASLLTENYVLVKVNVGDMNKNIGLAGSFGVRMEYGIPALVVMDARQHIVYSQDRGEFSSMHKEDPRLVTVFLEQWKGHDKFARSSKPDPFDFLRPFRPTATLSRETFHTDSDPTIGEKHWVKTFVFPKETALVAKECLMTYSIHFSFNGRQTLDLPGHFFGDFRPAGNTLRVRLTDPPALEPLDKDWSGRQDSNLRPHAPKARALPS